MNIIYRCMTENDLDSYQVALNSVISEQIYLGSATAKCKNELASFVKNVIERQFPQIVALHDCSVVGWCDILPHQREHTQHIGGVGMGVVKTFRNQGIGSRLLLGCLEKAKRFGFEKIELEVYADNTSAIGLYKKFGFQVEGVRRKSRKIEGKYQDIVHMAKFVDDDNQF